MRRGLFLETVELIVGAHAYCTTHAVKASPAIHLPVIFAAACMSTADVTEDIHYGVMQGVLVS